MNAFFFNSVVVWIADMEIYYDSHDAHITCRMEMLKFNVEHCV